MHEEKLFVDAWRALPGFSGDSPGWHTIPIKSCNGLSFRAGVHFPDRTEAVLVGFQVDSFPKNIRLPDGQGFSVLLLDTQPDLPGVWVVLHRQPAGNLEMFTKMAVDVLNILSSNLFSGMDAFNTFLHRIMAWQKFMEHPQQDELSFEEKIGLCGEIELLNDLLDCGVSSIMAVSAWVGPLKALHDFTFSNGGIEVKSTSSRKKNLVEITSAEQLDATLATPLFLATCQFSVGQSGKTLAEKLRNTRTRLGDNPSAVSIFESLLKNFNITDLDSFDSSDRFQLTDKFLFSVSGAFPALTEAVLPDAVQEVKYSLSVPQLGQFSTNLTEALVRMGVHLDGTS